MQINITSFLLTLLGIVLVLCFILMLMNNQNQGYGNGNGFMGGYNNNDNIEGFDPVVDSIQSQLEGQTPAQLKSTISTIQQRLIDYGYAPDLSTYVKKTELTPNSGKCLVSTAEDRDKYIPKSDVPAPGPRIDLSQYVKKSSIPPAPVCPPTPEIDYSAYVKKSTLPPNDKCPPCIAPKVKVSAGLCRECPPAPSCPPPERCPDIKCPPPAPCPAQVPCTKCDEIRYIKVPSVITKTVMVDANGNVMSQQIDSGKATPSPVATTAQVLTPYVEPTAAPVPTPSATTQYQTQSILNSIFSPQTTQGSQIPSTTFPAMAVNIPNTTLAQTLDRETSSCHKHGLYPSADLNSEFKRYGIYGDPR